MRAYQLAEAPAVLKLRINFLEGENSTLLSAATACTCARTSSCDGTPQEGTFRYVKEC